VGEGAHNSQILYTTHLTVSVLTQSHVYGTESMANCTLVVEHYLKIPTYIDQLQNPLPPPFSVLTYLDQLQLPHKNPLVSQRNNLHRLFSSYK
jgi:hypothetical protein